MGLQKTNTTPHLSRRVWRRFQHHSTGYPSMRKPSAIRTLFIRNAVTIHLNVYCVCVLVYSSKCAVFTLERLCTTSTLLQLTGLRMHICMRVCVSMCACLRLTAAHELSACIPCGILPPCVSVDVSTRSLDIQWKVLIQSHRGCVCIFCFVVRLVVCRLFQP